MKPLPELPPEIYVAKNKDYNDRAVRAAAAGVAAWVTGPAADRSARGVRFRAYPVFGGLVALARDEPRGRPRPGRDSRLRWSYLVTPSPYTRWAQVFEPEAAIARAGYAIRTDIGRDCRLTITRMWVDRDGAGGWVAFANARQLSGDARLEAHVTVPLDVELTHLTSGYLAGTTPGEVVLDYLAECGPPEYRDRFLALAACFV